MRDREGTCQVIEVHIVPGILRISGFGVGELCIHPKLHQKSERVYGSIGSRIGSIDLIAIACTLSDTSAGAK